MVLSRYKWSVRFGELRSFLARSSIEDRDRQFFKDWVEESILRFPDQFSEQAIPYITQHHHAPNLDFKVELKDEESLRLCQLNPSLSVSMMVPLRSLSIADLEPRLARQVTEMRVLLYQDIGQDVYDFLNLGEFVALKKLSILGLYSMTTAFKERINQTLEHLTVNPSLDGLEELYINQCGLMDKQVELLTTRHWPSLRVLLLANNDITDDGARLLAKTRGFPQLKKLIASSNYLTDRGVLALAESRHLSDVICEHWVALYRERTEM